MKQNDSLLVKWFIILLSSGHIEGRRFNLRWKYDKITNTKQHERFTQRERFPRQSGGKLWM